MLKLRTAALIPIETFREVVVITSLRALGYGAHLKQPMDLNAQGKHQLVSDLIGIPPSSGDFICIDTKHDGLAAYHNMLAEDIIVRPLSSYKVPQH
ncbi:MAG: hypothetical protein QS721_07360 [Candidatus Endonucleobacter sp. (ex Gigantidas childressi)]|nr:hypothetical protein [Candidatus Endonucleobacter sp. (ex Gigantidas childressi)]MDP0562141.1 hypothetical protein [Candidatus Endonucleobacter sp. (ex Gigantidas childressi)]